MKMMISICVFINILFAQEHMLLQPGGITGRIDTESLHKQKISQMVNKRPEKVKPYDGKLTGVTGTVDTLAYSGSWNTNFGFFGQDIMLQWFEAPADMIINAVSFGVSDNAGKIVSVKLVKLLWDKEQVQYTQNNGEKYWGYYNASGNGYNNATAFLDNPDRTGEWIDSSGLGWGSPFAEDIWSDNGNGVDVENLEIDKTYWVDMPLLGFSPEILSGDIIGIAVKNEATMLDTLRIGIYADNNVGITGFKYYANGRLKEGKDFGWWSRLFTWDMQMAVDLGGCRAPIIDVNILKTTLKTTARRAEALYYSDNPSGGPTQRDTLGLHYWNSISEEWTTVIMDSLNKDTFEAYIPGFPAGTEIEYYVRLENKKPVCGNVESYPVYYKIFDAQSPTLLVYDDNQFGIATVKAFWMAGVDSFTTYDIWEGYFGPISTELIDHYNTIIHLMGAGPQNQIDSTGFLYKKWLGQAVAGNEKNLFISGQDYGYISGFEDTTFSAGSFEYEYLGIETLGPQDLNYFGNDSDLTKPWIIDYVENDPLSGWLSALDNDTSILSYNPTGPLGFDNWIDNMTLSGGTAVFADPNTGGSPVAVRNEGAHWKSTFWALDPLGLDMISREDSARIFWVFSHKNPIIPVIKWFGLQPTSIDESSQSLSLQQFQLAQNYPNPFNPLTTIQYTIGAHYNAPLQVSLKIYDVMGREVKSLINTKQTAGKYQVSLDASALASGVYYYKLLAGDFTQTKKMLLIK